MRRLVACDSCRRQYDASSLEAGRRFRCRCGRAVSVPALPARDAAVVRCSSCGAPRAQGAAACAACGSDFTLRELDLETICPACLTRIANGARFCHHCGTPIVVEGAAGAATDLACPACADGGTLRSRVLAGAGPPLLECPRCGGIWLGQDAFRTVLESAREGSDPAADARAIEAATSPRARTTRQRGALYRPCPVCAQKMARRNHGQRSGVIVDSCPGHGVWFDSEELDGILRWIRRGGETLAARREQRERESAALRERFRVEPRTDETAWPGQAAGAGRRTDLVRRLLETLFDL